MIDWSVSVDKTGEQTLNMWATRLNNPKPAFDEMADALAAVQKEWWKTGGQGTWTPVKEPYRSWKRKHFPKRGTLHGPDRKGHRGLQLRDQLTKRPFGIERITSTELVIGSDLPYAAAHQYGRGNLPVRKPLKPLDARTEAMLTHILKVHIVGNIIDGNN